MQVTQITNNYKIVKKFLVAVELLVKLFVQESTATILIPIAAVEQ